MRAQHIGVAALLFGLLTAALAFCPATAAAADSAAAEALFQRAKALADAGDWQAACPKFEASYAADKQLGTLLNSANCREQLNHVATAWARWSEAEQWARRIADGRVGYIEGRRSALEPRLPRLAIEATPAPGLTVYRGDTRVAAASYGVPLPTDPGSFAIQVRRNEQVLYEVTHEAKEGETSSVSLDLAGIAAKFPVVEPKPVPLPTQPSLPPPPPYDPTQRNVGFIVGGVGAAAILTAVGLEVAALVKQGEADEPDACVNQYCSPRGLAAAQDGATFAEAGQWVGIGGVAALAIGATVLLTAPSDDTVKAAPASEPLVAAPWWTPDGAGVALGGSF